MSLLTLLLFFGGALVSSLRHEKQFYDLDLAEVHFEEFIQTYERNYPSQEEKQKRFDIFKMNLEEMNKLNQDSEHAVFGITNFSDLTHEEFLKMYTGFNGQLDPSNCTVLKDKDITTKDAPESFDWREQNAVTRVKNQKDCGSCWAFSTIGNIEGQHAIKHGELVELSEQQVVDCDDTSGGCELGGFMVNSFSKLATEGGVVTDADYPYIAQDSGQCKFDANKIKAKVTGCLAYDLRDQDVVKELLYKTGPLSIGMYVSGSVSKYTGGILSADKCPAGNINHAVLLVGYGTDNGTPYWIIKNSWDTKWGENGYLRLHRNKNENICAIMNSYFATATVG